MKKSIKSLKRLNEYMSPYKISFYVAIILIAISVVMNGFMPYITGLPMTRMAENIKDGVSIDFVYIYKILIILVAIGVIYSITNYLGQYLMTNVVQRAMSDLRTEIDQKINRLPVAYFDKHKFGDVLSRVTNDVDAVSNAMQQSFLSILNALLSIVIAVVALFLINSIIALVVILVIPLSILISKLVVNKSQKYFKGQQNALGALNGFVQENLTGFSVLKLYGRERETISAFKHVNGNLAHNGFRAAALSAIMMPLVNLSSYAAYIAVAVVGSAFILQGLLTIGNLQACIQYIWQISQPMGQITQLSSILQSASAATNRIFELLDEPEESVNDVDIALPKKVFGDVSFDNVSFSYTPDKPLIKAFNVDVKSGQTVAIVGPTGAGKTTLINLLMRFYDVNEGAIKIDGIDTKKMKRSDVRSLFGMVLQDAWLYNDTIAENIRFGKLDATDYEVVDAAKIANVDHFIKTMPDGYNMEINEEGDNLSLGQKQLLTIARAIISDPKILILDEATSSVDTRLEALIQKAMDRIMKGRTSFVIAHRLSTIKEADLILVMDQGQIVEQGTHESLLNKKGFYEKLYNSQFQEEME